jgi:hypothetical protein
VIGTPLAVALDPENWILGDFNAVPAGVADPAVPASASLAPAWPNPSSGHTSIEFELPRAGRVALRVFDAGGRMVRDLVRENRGEGHHRIDWDGTGADGRPLENGAYFLQLVGPGGVSTQDLILLR